MLKLQRLVVVTLVLLFLGSLVAIGQTSNGTIAGVVIDPTGAAVTTATVTAKNNLTGETRTTKTNSVGAYRFEAVMPGTFTLTVTAPSFAKTTVENVQVVASNVTAINATMKLGAASETVTVEAQGQALQTESGEISKNITTSEITNLPISSLSPYALASTLPGVITGAAGSFSNGQNFSVNGTRSRSNNFLIEGQDNNDAGIHGQAMQPENLEAVKEVAIQTNAYGAEFGHGGGSVSNLVYKSGTNQFHGSLWELYLGSALDANSHYNNKVGNKKSVDHENIFGFAFGGPIVKDKAFFFASYQWDKYRSSTNGGNITVLTPNGIAALQSLSAGASAFQKQQINTLLAVYNNPQLKGPFRNNTMLALGPSTDANGFPNGPDRGFVEAATMNRTGIPQTSESPELDLKGDYMPTQNDTIGLRFIRTYYTTPYDLGNFPNQLPGFDTYQYGPAYNAGITETHVFSPRLVNEFRASYQRIGFTFDWRPDTYSNPYVQNGTVAAVSISGLTGFGPPGSTPQGRFHNTYQLQDSVSWTKGNHTFKFGFDIADIRIVDTIPLGSYFGSIGYSNVTCRSAACGGSSASPLTWSSIANFIDGFGGSSSVSRAFGNNKVRAPQFSQNYFVQDSWKLRPNFTVTYGLRYEYTGPVANNIPYPAVDPKDFAPASYPVVVKQVADTNDFGPRVGFAYTPRFARKIFGDNKTVIRGGAGIFYDQIFTNILDNNQGGAPNMVPASYVSAVSSTKAPRGLANWTYNNYTGNLSPVLSRYSGVTSMWSNLRSPETYQWNFTIQRELPAAFTLTAAYVGTRGAHLYGQTVMNPYNNYGGDLDMIGTTCGNGATYCRLIADRGNILVRDNSGDSIYHALQVEVNRKLVKGFEFRSAYTWSKTIDDVSEIFTTGNYSAYPLVEYGYQSGGRGRFDRSNSALDRRQRLVLTYIYNTPKVHAPSFKENPALAFMGKVVNDWSISGQTTFQSGALGNVQDGYLQNSYDWNWDGIGNDRPSLLNAGAPLANFAVMENGKLCDGAVYMYSWTCQTTWATDPTGKNRFNPYAGQAVTTANAHWLLPNFGTQTPNPTGRNTFATPGSQAFNIAVAKAYKLTEKQSLAFRAEFYNPFNHANTGVPTLTLQSGAGLPPGYATSKNTDGSWKTLQPYSYVPTLGDLSQTLSGSRSIRMQLKYSF